MNPLTDKTFPLLQPDGTTVQVHIPGGNKPSTQHWRHSEKAFRAYEPHIRRALAAWPSESEFHCPEGMSINTFEHRMRDAIQALVLFGYDEALKAQVIKLREEFVVSTDPSGKSVWFRARQKRGRQISLIHRDNPRPSAPHASQVRPAPTEQSLRAFCLLLASSQLDGPLIFRGKIDDALRTDIELHHDIAFAYEPLTDTTTIL